VDPLTPRFVAALVLTVAALLLTAWTGHRAKRSLHYGCVVAMLALLCWAIVEARLIGDGLVFEGAAHVVKIVHFVFVGLVFALLPLLVTSGVKLARQEDAGVRASHRKRAAAFIVCMVITTGLGTAMTLMATPRADVSTDAVED
jgi:drug/metabolite transporter (DMT)-like permease